jgi:hypothetical protein
VGGHELLLLTDSAQEAERVHPKTDYSHNRQGQERRAGSERYTHTFTPIRWS